MKLCLSFFALLLSVARALATDAALLAGPGYSLRVWQIEDGLPQNAVTTLAQSYDGYLWVGTYGGLARFDGVHFESFEPATTPGLNDHVVVGLFADPKGVLWIGHGSGALTRYEAGVFRAMPASAPPEQEGIRGLGTDARGTLWAFRDNGRLDAIGESKSLSTLPKDTAASLITWARSSEGAIWVLANGEVTELANGQLRPVVLPDATSNPFTFGIATAKSGGLWIARDGQIRRLVDGQWVESLGGYPWSNDTVTSMLELRDGTVAIGTLASGLFLLFRDGRATVRFDQTHGLPQNWIRCLFEDQEGNLWAGAGSGGLVSLHATAISRFDSPDHWGGRSVLCAMETRDGSRWFGTEGAGAYQWKDGVWKTFRDNEGLDNPYLWAMAQDREDHVWIGSWTGGPHVLVNGHFQRLAGTEEIQGPVRALWMNPSSSEVLIGARNGVLQYFEGKTRWLLRTEGSYSKSVSTALRDESGALWVGLSKDGLGRLDNDTLTIFGPEQGIEGDVYCLHVDAPGTLWVGTGHGLVRLRDGRFDRITQAHGLIGSIIGHILDDGRGSFWISSNRGLQRIRKEDLQACADGRLPVLPSRRFDRSDGLPTIEFTSGLQASAYTANDGTLWFTTTKGVVVVNPNLLQERTVAPAVVIESMRVDGRVIPFPTTKPEQRLAPSHQRLEFHFTAPCFATPNRLRFRYQLVGLDSEWVEAGDRRSAYYSQLPGGTYEFKVASATEEGEWSRSATIAFTVTPFVWQTPWFLLSSSLLVITAASLTARHVTRRRLQKRIKLIEQRHALEQERARIAQDIHDDVGASLSKIAMLSQPTAQELQEPEEIKSTLGNIYATAREVTTSLDEIVWAVDPSHDSLDSLVDYMARYAQHFLASARMRCRLDLPVETPSWPVHAEVRHHLFLAFKETLHNTAKHSGANEARISLSILRQHLTLTVADNGTGLASPRTDISPRPGGGHGRRNLEARMKRIGGNCTFSSHPGEGTIVTLTVTLEPPENSLT